MYNRRIITLGRKDFNHKLSVAKKFTIMRFRERQQGETLVTVSYLVDKITRIELTIRDPELGGKRVTYRCDKSESAIVHQANGATAYSTLQKYYKTPAVNTSNDALFSVAGVLYYNEEYVNTRQHAYGYDMNSAFAWGMLQDMPKDTEKGPINLNKKKGIYNVRIVKADEIGFGFDGKLALEGEYALYIFKRMSSPYGRFVEHWYNIKKNPKTPEEKIKAKDMLVMSVGYMQRRNFWMRAAIIGHCNRLINSIIAKYPHNVLLSNTDSIVSNIRIPEIEANLGKEVGQWKFEHDGQFAYINTNYQWDNNRPTFRGTAKSWFKEGWDILKDPRPESGNKMHYDSKLNRLVKEKI